MNKYGFTASEYERARVNVLKNYESNYKERDKQKNVHFTINGIIHLRSGRNHKRRIFRRKRELTAKIRDIEKRISAANGSEGSGSADLSFIKKASAFLVAQHIASEEHIDYMQLVTDLDNAIIKDFIDQLIDKFLFQDGKIMRIRFVSGLEHEFMYEE